MKGVSELVSFIIITLLVVVAIGLVLGIGLPLLDQGRDSGLINEARQNLLVLDDLIRQTASEGTGSLKTAQISVTGGDYRVNAGSNSIDFTTALSSNILPKGTYLKQGNLLTIVSGAASATQNSTSLVLENEILKVTFAKIGSQTSFDGINTSTILTSIASKSNPTTGIAPDNLAITINGIKNTSWGLGYTALTLQGSSLPQASVLAHVRSNTTGVEYDVLYTLPASSDFMTIQVRNTTSNQTTLTYTYKLGSNSSNDVLKIGDVNETTFSAGGSVTTISASSQSLNLANTNSSQNSSALSILLGSVNILQYNASDGSLRNVSELADIGQGNWSFSTNSSSTTLNYNLAGADGYEFGVRDSLPGGSYWLNNDSSLYGRINISNDFITVGMDENDMWVYNNSGKVIFNTSFNNSVKLDGQTLTSLYGSGTQNKTVYFYDWSNQTWKIWMKGASVANATQGMPNWLDPRNKQEFKWRYAFFNDTSVSRPNTNITFIMTAADPLVRTFVDTSYPSSTVGTTGGSPGSQAATLGNVYVQKLTGLVPGSSFDTLSVNIASIDGSSIRLKAYQDDGAGGAPSTLILESPPFPISSTGWQNFTFGSAGKIPASGNIWIGFETNTNPGPGVFRDQTTTQDYVVHTFGTGPSPFGTVSTQSLGWNMRLLFMGTKTSNITVPISLPENRTSVTTADPGLVGYWNFEENGGSRFADSSGSGKTASCLSGACPLSGYGVGVGNSLSFNGVNNTINVTSPGVLDVTGPLSVAVWAKPGASTSPGQGQGYAVEMGNGNDFSNNYQLWFDSRGPQIAYFSLGESGSGACYASYNTKVDGSSVYFVVGTFDGTTGRLFLNGTQVATCSFSGSRQSGGQFRIGGRIDGWNYNGTIDEVRVYNRAISQGEINQLYKTGLNQQKPGIFFTKNNATDNEEIFLATSNFKNLNRSVSPSYFNVFSNHTNFFGFNYTFNSTLNQNFMFALGTMGRMNTTTFNPQTNTSQFSGETIESIANSTMTYYDIGTFPNVTSGGTITYTNQSVVETFLSSGTLNVAYGITADILVVGGGGSGGGGAGGNLGSGGGGGAGSYKYMTSVYIPAGLYSVVVGNGGTGVGQGSQGNNGQDSSFNGIVATGGGGGGVANGAGNSGGSGGGGGSNNAAGGSATGTGNAGGTGGTTDYQGSGAGGGGQTSVGGNGGGQAAEGGSGGTGQNNSINGSVVCYAGGGEGGSVGNYTVGRFSCGGGYGGYGANAVPGSGTPNTGGGGGGGGSGGSPSFDGGANGGSGIVIIRYPLNSGVWNVTSPSNGIAQHKSSPAFYYEGGAAGIWHFDEGSGLNATDASGNGNVGTLVGGPTWISNSTCKSSGCLYFNSNYINAGTSFLGMTKVVSVEAWVMTTTSSGSAKGIAATRNGNVYGGYVCALDDGSDHAAWVVDTSASPGSIPWDISLVGKTAIQSNVWYHVVCTYDSSTGIGKIYLNGVLDAIGTASGTISFSNSDFLKIGEGYTGSQYFVGYMDDVKIYSRALTDTEAREHYLQGASKYYDDFGTATNGKTYRYYGVEDSNTSMQPIDPSGTILHYRFNDNSTTNVTDNSGNGLTGGVNGTTWMTNSSCNNNFGGCMYFNGNGAYIVPSATTSTFNFIRNTGVFSEGAWIKPDLTKSYNMIIGDTPACAESGSIFRFDNAGGSLNHALEFSIENFSGGSCSSAFTTPPNVITDNNWHHVFVTGDGTRIRFYVDGQQYLSGGTISSNSGSSARLMRIGATSYPGSEYFFNGTIDEVMIVNRTMSPDEIYNLYLGGAQRHGGDLVGWWRFNHNTTGNVTLDGSGNGNTGSVNSTTWMNNASCRLNGCTSFSGSGDVIIVNNSASLNSKSMTVSAWVNERGNTSANTNQGIVSKEDLTVNTGYLFFMDGTSPIPRMIYYNGTAQVGGLSASSIGYNTWAHVTWVIDDANRIEKIYINGSLSSSTQSQFNGSVADDQGALVIGARDANPGDGITSYFNGTLDNVKIWKRALTQDEVRMDYLGSDNEAVYGRIHRVASVDDLQLVSYNLTAKNSTFETRDYDRRILSLNGSIQTITVNSMSPVPACYTKVNVSQYYICSYDQTEFSPSKASGIMYSADTDDFVSVCQDNAYSEYLINVTGNNAFKSVVPLASATCSAVGNQSLTVQRQGLPSSPFGSYSLSGPSTLEMSMQYDRIALNGTLEFGQGPHKICIRKAGRQGSTSIVNIVEC